MALEIVLTLPTGISFIQWIQWVKLNGDITNSNISNCNGELFQTNAISWSSIPNVAVFYCIQDKECYSVLLETSFPTGLPCIWVAHAIGTKKYQGLGFLTESFDITVPRAGCCPEPTSPPLPDKAVKWNIMITITITIMIMVMIIRINSNVNSGVTPHLTSYRSSYISVSNFYSKKLQAAKWR